MKTLVSAIGVLALCVFLAAGCVTKEYVQEEMNPLDRRLSEIETQMIGLNTRISDNQEDIDLLEQAGAEQETRMSQFSALAHEALMRAEAAEKLAEGALIGEKVLSAESIPFAFNSAELTDEARSQVDAVVERLIADNADVYIEVQGFTDDTGPDNVNLALGKRRATSVARYIYEKHNLPLHRLNTFSYGEANPLVPNDSLENRKKNRRVAIIVMR
jgi:peptidoglycan-associated lipoprotein